MNMNNCDATARPVRGAIGSWLRGNWSVVAAMIVIVAGSTARVRAQSQTQGGSAPSKTAPSEAAPSETAPSETGPWKTAPWKTAPWKTAPLAKTSVGMRARIVELPLPGSQLRAKPVKDPQRADLILQVINVFPHGNSFRYTLEVTPLIEGRLDLRAYLERVDGSKMTDLPEIPVEVDAFLPADRIRPNELRAEEPDSVGGYFVMQVLFGLLWVAGLIAILFVRKKKPVVAEAMADQGPISLADRLRPLIEEARSGALDASRHGELERLLLAYWRERRNLGDQKISAAIMTLRKDPEASPLFLQLEEWLHKPQSVAAGSDTDSEANAEMARLLEPYVNAPAVVDARAGDKERASA